MTDTPNGGHTPPGGYAAYLTGRLAALGLSRNALARALGHKGASQVSRWCAGKAVPREKARRAIDEAIAQTVVARALIVREREVFEAAIANGTPPEMARAEAVEVRKAYLQEIVQGQHNLLAAYSPQDAPGGPISGGAVSEDTPKVALRGTVYWGVGQPDPGPVVERYVVEGG